MNRNEKTGSTFVSILEFVRLAITGLVLGATSAAAWFFAEAMLEGLVHRRYGNLVIPYMVFFLPWPLEMYWAKLISKRSKVRGVCFGVAATAGTIVAIVIGYIFKDNVWLN